MTDIDTLDAELSELRRKAAKRRDVVGFASNVQALQDRIAALEAQRAALAEPPAG